ncbi:MAG TPA: AraC family transcriptional regulator [Caulobacteraceae bacterium]
MAEPSVSAGYARGLFELAVARGADRAALAAQGGVAPAELADQDARIPFARYMALMRAAKALSGDAALGLHYGEAVDISEVSLVGLIGHASATMGEAFVQTNRYVRLIVDVPIEGPRRFALEADGRGVWIVDKRKDPDAFPELGASAFAQLVCAPRRAVGVQFVRELSFTHPAPAHAAEYERVFQAPVAFGAARNAMRIDAAGVAAPVARLPRYAFGILSERADALMQRLEGDPSARGRVESLLMPILHTGEAGMEAAARALGMSRQTLFRRLKAEGVTFEQVLDELRRRLALDYLAGRKVSVSEVAYLVGFSDPAAFSRAFKRWTGQSPRSFRRGGAQ